MQAEDGVAAVQHLHLHRHHGAHVSRPAAGHRTGAHLYQTPGNGSHHPHLGSRPCADGATVLRVPSDGEMGGGGKQTGAGLQFCW